MNDEEDDELDVARGIMKTKYDQQRHKRHISNLSASSLPDYRSRHAPSSSISSTLWNVAEDNPPDYSADEDDPFLSPRTDPTSADEADTEYEPPRTRPSTSLILGRGRRLPGAHRRSRSEQIPPLPAFSRFTPASRGSRTDSMLERSVQALEVSNALLQSSMSTRASLSTVLLDRASSPSSQQTGFRIDSLSMRFAASDVVTAQMDDLLATAHDIADGSELSQSAPSSSMLHASQAMGSGSSPRRSQLSLSSNKHHSPRRSPLRTQFGQSHSSPAPMEIEDLPHSPHTAAYTLLSSIGVRSPPSSRQRFRGIRSTTSSLSDLRGAATNGSFIRARHSMGSLAPGPIRRAKSFESIRSERGSRPRIERFPKAALVSVISPRFFDSHAKRSPRRSGADGRSEARPVATETIASLRRILLYDQQSSRARDKEREQQPHAPRVEEAYNVSEGVTRPRIVRSRQSSPLPSPSPSPLRQELRISEPTSPLPPSSQKKPRRLTVTPSVVTRPMLGLGRPPSYLPSEGRIRFSREGL